MEGSAGVWRRVSWLYKLLLVQWVPRHPCICFCPVVSRWSEWCGCFNLSPTVSKKVFMMCDVFWNAALFYCFQIAKLTIIFWVLWCLYFTGSSILLLVFGQIKFINRFSASFLVTIAFLFTKVFFVCFQKLSNSILYLVECWHVLNVVMSQCCV